MRNNTVKAIIAGFLLVIGTLTLTYPFASQWVKQYYQTQANEELADSVKMAGPEYLDKIRENANNYNNNLYSGIIDDSYFEQMLVPGTDVIGRLRVPAINLDQPIRHTLDEASLLSGVGHAEGSSLPIGGANTHTVLGGHRGLAESVGFTNLPKLKIGDIIYVEILGETLTYKIYEKEILEPLEAAVHPIEYDKDLLTLLTCTPLGVNSHRLIVTAERVLSDDNIPFGQMSDLPGFPLWIIIGLTGLTLSIFASYRVAKK